MERKFAWLIGTFGIWARSLPSAPAMGTVQLASHRHGCRPVRAPSWHRNQNGSRSQMATVTQFNGPHIKYTLLKRKPRRRRSVTSH